MVDITKKTIGQLIDELSIANIKSFWFQEIVMTSEDADAVKEAAKASQNLNARRSQLVKAIDRHFGIKTTPDEKTYE